MDRLTEKRRGARGYYMACSKNCASDAEMCGGCPWLEKIINRLGAYEDAGMGPEEFDHLRELARAEKDGRLVVLPCKVGDTVYMLDSVNIPVPLRVQGISITYSSKTILHFGGYPIKNAWGDDVGKTVFLTREEAEAALEAQKGGTK